MAIPTQSEMNVLVLEFMNDDKSRRRREIISDIKNQKNFTQEELIEKTYSGVNLIDSRISWSTTYLHRAGYLERNDNSIYIITKKGRDILNRKLPVQNFNKIMHGTIKQNNPWNVKSKEEIRDDKEDKIADFDASPIEKLEALANDINNSIYEELIRKVYNNGAAFFENLVIQLLEKMGYGEGFVTQLSNDGGIDGFITTDELGLRKIMTQAKCFALDTTIGRPEIQKFVGALDGNDGVFITTAIFTNQAVEYAKNCKTNIVLVNGKKLAELMLKYNLGVSTDRVIEIKKIDNDYFEE